MSDALMLAAIKPMALAHLWSQIPAGSGAEALMTKIATSVSANRERNLFIVISPFCIEQCSSGETDY
mgnify:CR=1 FL=1